jgi:hypothetical protein
MRSDRSGMMRDRCVRRFGFCPAFDLYDASGGPSGNDNRGALDIRALPVFALY